MCLAKHECVKANAKFSQQQLSSFEVKAYDREEDKYKKNIAEGYILEIRFLTSLVFSSVQTSAHRF